MRCLFAACLAAVLLLPHRALAQQDDLILGTFNFTLVEATFDEDGGTFRMLAKEIGKSNAPQLDDVNLVGWRLELCGDLEITEFSPLPDGEGIISADTTSTPARFEIAFEWGLGLDYDLDGTVEGDSAVFEMRVAGATELGLSYLEAESVERLYTGFITGPSGPGCEPKGDLQLADDRGLFWFMDLEPGARADCRDYVELGGFAVNVFAGGGLASGWVCRGFDRTRTMMHEVVNPLADGCQSGFHDRVVYEGERRGPFRYGGTYAGYCGTAIDDGGDWEGTYSFLGTATRPGRSARLAIDDDVPDESFALEAVVYPQPAAAAPHLRVVLPVAADLTVDVYDMLGRRVLTHHAAQRTAGAHVIVLDDAPLAAGVYAFHVRAGDAQTRGSFILAR